jgi:SAM-dependent methyltransferase
VIDCLKQGCAICNSRLLSAVSAPERMFGMGGRFSYARCERCGLLAQQDVPADLSEFYPLGKYYSYSESTIRQWHANPFGGWVASKRNEAQLFGHPRWAVPLAKKRPSYVAKTVEPYVRHMIKNRGLEARILDVGCGGGQLLCTFASLGFKSLEGIDPFNRAEINLANKVRIRPTDVFALDGELFDLIILNHSLEHMSLQVATVRKLNNLLEAGGIVRIEVPVSDCHAHEIYGGYWIELDPPRHLYLHTRESLRRLSSIAGFEVVELEEVGTDFEFWGSEMYRRGLSLFDEAAGRLRAPESLFRPHEMQEFNVLADAARRDKKSGRVAAYLRKH